MSKFTRGQLKELVKECLVEILAEGLAHPPTSPEPTRERDVRQSRSTPVTRSPQASMPPRSTSASLNSAVFDNASRGGTSGFPRTESKKSTHNPVLTAIGRVTSDPIMSEIFADTAATTLAEQVQAEAGRPGAIAGSELTGEPDMIFDGAQNWASLAFSEPVKRQ